MSVTIVFTGGTIASRIDPASGAVIPQLRGDEVLAAAPEVAAVANVEPIDWGIVPASHLGFEQLVEIAALVDRALARPEVSGAVVVQGTDSIEETCFAYDLLVRSDKPVVVTGAMRNASQPDYDGPRNLLDAVRCAAAPDLAGMGTLVVLDGRIIGAEQAVKRHATAIDAFRARDGEVVGEVRGADVIVRDRRRRRRLPTVPERAAEPVHLFTVTVGSDGSLIRLAAEAGAMPGIVVAATGSGNTPLDVLTAAKELMERGSRVVLTTRCPSGAVQPAYGFPGGGAQWAQAGAILAGLDGPKCRVALALGLGAGLDRAGLEYILWATPSS